MVHWTLLPVALVLGVVLTTWVTWNRVEVALVRRYRDGVERGRYLESLGLDDDLERDAGRAISAIRRVGRVRTLLYLLRYEDMRRSRIEDLVREGVGL